MLNKFKILLILFFLTILCAPKTAEASWWWPFGYDGIKYSIQIDGLDNETHKWLKSLKLEKRNQATPPKNDEELAQELVTLGEKIRKALEAKGFYDATMQQKIENKHILHYTIQPGTRYKINTVNIIWPQNEKPIKNIDNQKLSLKSGNYIDAVLIQKDTTYIFNRLSNKTCFISLDIQPTLKLHGDSHNAELDYNVYHGDVANFGDANISGNKKVGDKAIERLIAWKKGECFDKKKVEKTQTSLIQNQLFASVKVTPDTAADANGQVPIDVVVKERVPHTIKAGVDFSTDQGAGLTFGWEHRNYFGNGEKLSADVTLNQQEQSLVSALRVPGFLRSDQTFIINGSISHEDTDAYLSDSIQSSIALERKLLPTLNAGLGVGYELKNTEDVLAGHSDYALLSLPGFLEYDTRDNSLDAHKGIFAHLALTPYTETFGDGGHFFKSQGTAQTYLTANRMKLKPTLAMKVTAGSISGQTGDNIPSDIRFYSGGSGSVRGYSYQSLGPRLNGTPIGGASIIEASTELRMHFTDTIGGVLFTDAGNSYNQQLPQLNEKLYYGAGVGARYYSPVGPIRLDVAFPINGSDIDQTGYQIYVSIGQEF